jgi:hypothetical protein
MLSMATHEGFCYSPRPALARRNQSGRSCVFDVILGTMWLTTSDDHTVNMTVCFRLIIIGESVFLVAVVVLFGIICYCTNSWDPQIIIVI